LALYSYEAKLFSNEISTNFDSTARVPIVIISNVFSSFPEIAFLKNKAYLRLALEVAQFLVGSTRMPFDSLKIKQKMLLIGGRDWLSVWVLVGVGDSFLPLGETILTEQCDTPTPPHCVRPPVLKAILFLW